MLKYLLVVLLVSTFAHAQPAQEYNPPDEELWNVMFERFSRLSMPLDAHQQIREIMQTVQREARIRATVKKNTLPKKEGGNDAR